MKIKNKKIIIKLIDGSFCELECASLSTITFTDIINELYNQKILMSEELGTDYLCDNCPILSCRAHRMYMGVKNGEVIKNPNTTLYEIGIRNGDLINIFPHAPCGYYYRSKVLYTGVSMGVLKLKIKNLDGRHFDWAIYIGEEPLNIKRLFEDLVSCKVLLTNSEMKKKYGSEYSKYGLLLQNGTSYSQDCDLTLQELGSKSGDEIWLGLVPSEFEPINVNMALKGIVVTN